MLLNFVERLAIRIKQQSDYRLDRQLSARDLISIVLRRTISLMRSFRWRPFLRQTKGPFFVGRSVTLRHANHLSIGRGVTLDEHVVIDSLSREGVILGDNVSVGAFTIIEATGILTDLGEGFRIGSNSNLGDYCFVGAAGGVSIGENVLIGQRVSFHSENHVTERVDIPIKAQGTTQQGIVVEDDVWLGSGAIILDGVTVHTGAVVAGGSVVAEDVPPYAVVAGVPAKVIRDRRDTAP